MSRTRRYERLQAAITKLGDLFEYGELQASTDPAQFLESAAAEIARLRERVTELKRERDEARAALAVVRRYVEDNPHGYPCSIMDDIRRGLGEEPAETGEGEDG